MKKIKKKETKKIKGGSTLHVSKEFKSKNHIRRLNEVGDERVK